MAKGSKESEYQSMVHQLRELSQCSDLSLFPKLIFITGSSEFLRQKTMKFLSQKWQSLTSQKANNVEFEGLEQSSFVSLWSQASLFDPVPFHLIHRITNQKNLNTWILALIGRRAQKSYLALDVGEKIGADLQKIAKQDNAKIIICVEPITHSELAATTKALGTKLNVHLTDEAVRLLVDSSSLNLSKIENELSVLALLFPQNKTPLTRKQVEPVIGAICEEDVFELFNLMRRGKGDDSFVLTELLVDRGESPLALNGIFTRFARELLERSGASPKAVASVLTCAKAERRLKSGQTHELIMLGEVLDGVAAVRGG